MSGGRPREEAQCAGSSRSLSEDRPKPLDKVAGPSLPISHLGENRPRGGGGIFLRIRSPPALRPQSKRTPWALERAGGSKNSSTPRATSPLARLAAGSALP